MSVKITHVAEWCCDRCGAAATVNHSDREHADPHADMPDGWRWVTVEGGGEENVERELCADCVARVRAVLDPKAPASGGPVSEHRFTTLDRGGLP